MNILLDSLSESVMIDDREYFIDTDFRTFIILEKILEEHMPAKEKVMEVIGLFYTDELPENAKAAMDKILELYRCGEKPVKKKDRKNGDVKLKPKMIYSFEHDAPYIFGAFMTQYHIDLNEIEYMHWWKFQALFRSLNNDNKIVEIMGYRAADLGKIKDSKERSRIARLKEIYALPTNLTFEEKVANAGAAFGGGAF